MCRFLLSIRWPLQRGKRVVDFKKRERGEGYVNSIYVREVRGCMM